MASEKPQIIYEYRCKVCQMSSTAPDLFRDLHSQILESGSSMNRAMNYINARIDAQQLTIPKLNNQNMSAHFSNHITIPERISVELAKVPGPINSSPPLTAINPSVGHEIEAMVRQRVGNDVGDYLNLDQLRNQLMEKLVILDELTSVTADEDGQNSINLDVLDRYVSVAKEIRSCILDLNKIRSSKELIKLVIKSLVEKQTFQIVKELSREYDQTKKDLLDAGVDNTIVLRIDQNLRLKLAEIVATTARNVISDVQKTYKLQ